MDAWIALARGPMFRVALAACLLGLAYHLVNTLWMIIQSHRRSTDKELSLGTVLAATLGSLLPLRRRRPLQTIAGLAFHAGILLVPLFYVGHVPLWQPPLPIPSPALGPTVSDALSLAALAGLAGVLMWRLLVRTSRERSAALVGRAATGVGDAATRARGATMRALHAGRDKLRRSDADSGADDDASG